MDDARSVATVNVAGTGSGGIKHIVSGLEERRKCVSALYMAACTQAQLLLTLARHSGPT